MGTEPQSTDSSLADCRAPWCFDSPTTASLMAPQEDVVSRRLARWWPPPRRGDEPTAASAPRQRRGGVWHGVSQAWSGAQRTKGLEQRRDGLGVSAQAAKFDNYIIQGENTGTPRWHTQKYYPLQTGYWSRPGTPTPSKPARRARPWVRAPSPARAVSHA